MNYCQYCGTEINDKDAFCANCGNSVTGPSNKKNLKPKTLFIIAAVSLILSAVSALITGYLNSTALSGNAAALSGGGNDNMQLVFAYAFLLFLVFGLVALTIAIIKKIKSK
ncbi:MAG: zinc-ribbon domain-containing protein [Ruminococcaceae bacterium]|nr:zinc-ribbon domain-containing protein [Oscillospiraceae bacterium]